MIDHIIFGYEQLHPSQVFDTNYGNHQTMLDHLYAGKTPYFISNHLPPESQLWAAPIGQDGIVIIANLNIKLDGITTEQLRAIYQGQITSWDQLGEQQGDIIVFSREEGSGTRAEFERMVMGRRQVTPNARVTPSNTYMMQSIARLPDSIGYVSMSHLDDSVNVLVIDGIYPTPDTIFNNLYPLRSTIFVIGMEEPDEQFRVFIGWLQSPAGQAIIAEHYTPLTIPGESQK